MNGCTYSKRIVERYKTRRVSSQFGMRHVFKITLNNTLAESVVTSTNYRHSSVDRERRRRK